MSGNHKMLPQDHSGGEYRPLTLKDVKAMVESTVGHRRPTPKQLRECETLLVRKEMEDCCLEVYSCGFAVYQTAYHYTVMRMEEVGKAEYSSVTEPKSCGINTENMDWSIGVILCGEARIEAEFLDKASDRLVSMAWCNFSECGDDWHEMEFASNVDVERDFLEADMIDMMLSTLAERQKRIVHMYYFQGMTHREIADVLNVDRSTVSKCIKTISIRAKKYFHENFT